MDASTASSPFGGGLSRFQTVVDFSAVKDSTQRIRANLAQGQGLDSALLGALSNAFLLVGVGIFFLIYRIMEQFIRPIAWALLAGATLFPLKSAIKNVLKRHLEAKEEMLSLSIFAVPGRVSKSLLGLCWENVRGFIGLGAGIAFGLSVEWLGTMFLHMFVYAPLGFSFAQTVLEQWGNFSQDSIVPVLGWSLLIGVPLVILFRRSRVVHFLSSVIWAVVVLWVVPTVYSMNPTVMMIPFLLVVSFLAVGLARRNKKNVVAAVAEAATASTTSVTPKISRGGRRALRKVARKAETEGVMSSRIVSFLAVGCASVLGLRYVPYVIFCVLILSRINGVWLWIVGKLHPSEELLQILLPPPIRWVAKVFQRGDFAFRAFFFRHVDSIATLVTLLILVIGAVSLSGYFSVCIYQEAQEIGYNATRVWKSLSNKLPTSVNESVTGALVKSIEWVEENWLNRTDLALSAKFFNFSSSVEGVSLREWPDFAKLSSVYSEWDDWIKSAKDSGRLVLSYVLHSVYSVLLQMTGVLFASFIFFTVLFYLLAASHDTYRPFAWIRELQVMGGNLDQALIVAVENVFHSTIMVATFHGLFTWISFSLVRARWIALSTVFSFMLATLPFVGPYWVAVPSCIELAYSRENLGPAISIMGSQIFVYFMVDPIIYGETGAHPYLTALSVVGGMYLLGFEGIVLGPLAVVILHVILEYLKGKKGPKVPLMMDLDDTTMETPVNIKKRI